MSKHKLLLADDSITIQKVVNLTFADEGIEVVAVGDGDSAMKKFVEVMPDLVLVDVNMPGLDGYRICEMIKQDEETRHIPVILLVGSFEPFDEEEARRVGADDFLTKPFQSIRQLVNKVTDLLNADGNGQASGLVSEAIAVNNFDDTLQMKPDEEPEVEETIVEDLGDAGMDDEMIQTSQIGSLPTDEAHKFVSEPSAGQSFAEDVDLNSLKQPYNFENSADDAEEDDFGKTSPLTVAELEEITAVSADSETARLDEEVSESANEENFADDEEIQTSEHDFSIGEHSDEAGQTSTDDDVSFNKQSSDEQSSETISMLENTSGLELDDFDLLELPRRRRNKSSAEISGGTQNLRPAENANDSMSSVNLSPETIEAVANLVVEKLSEKVIRNTVKEVIAQMAKKK